MIKSRVWATQYSLRFPRIQRIHWDKSPFDAQTVQDLRALVHDNQGALVGECLSCHIPWLAAKSSVICDLLYTRLVGCLGHLLISAFHSAMLYIGAH